jgi:STE24 endopeptidase
VERSRWGLPLALVAAVVTAEAAVLVLRPREGVIDPAPVSARSYFSAREIDRARDYRRPQLALLGAQLLIEGGVLVLLVRRPPRWLRRTHRRRLGAAAATGAALTVALGVATLPVAAVAHQRARDVGLSTQSWGGWVGDLVKSGLVGVLFGAVGGVLAIVLVRRFPRHWWAPGAVAVVAIGAAFTFAGPVVLDPLFNKFKPLPAGQVRSEVLELARAAHVSVGQVYEVDASRRTTAANAYVTGLGSTKRVVIYDTLLKRFSRDEARLVVAHELGHVHYRDGPRGLLWLLLAAPAGLLAIQRLTERWTADRGPAMLPALALALGLVSFGGTVISNQLSRRVEQRADSFALQLTHAPKPFIGFQRRIALQNLADPDPPAWSQWLLGTHPTTVQRIGLGVAFERGARG